MFEQVLPGIYVLRTTLGEIWSGVTLLCGKENILIDCGTAAVVQTELLPALFALGLRPQDISKILVTHTHADHIGGLCEMQRLSGALQNGLVERVNLTNNRNTFLKREVKLMHCLIARTIKQPFSSTFY